MTTDLTDECLLSICTSEGDPRELHDGAYGMKYVGGVTLAENHAVEIAGYVYDESLQKVRTLVPEEQLPTTPTRGMYVVTVREDEVVDITGREVVWWPVHPEDSLPLSLPNGEVKLEFDDWVSHNRNRYGGVVFSGSLLDEGIDFSVSIPRDKLPVDDENRFEGLVLSHEITSLRPV